MQPSLLQNTFSYANRRRKQTELMLVPMIDIFTVLVTFLLMTAVFSRITILQLELPSSAASGPPTPPTFRLEVIVRHEGFELTDGKDVIAVIPKVDGAYDLKTLSQAALALKREHLESEDASVLLEPDIEYDSLVQVMDAVRTTQIPPADGSGKPEKVALFANIAVGDAP